MPKNTSLVIYDPELWAWAQYRAKVLGIRNTSEYVHRLIKKDRKSVEEKRRKGG